MKRLLTIAILGLLLPVFTFAQETGEKETEEEKKDYPFEDYRSEKLKNLGPKKKLKIANSLYEKGSYVNALMYYEEALKDKPDNACIISRLAKLNYLVRDYKKAEGYYQMFYELDTEKFAKAKYMQALMQKYNGKCEEAKTNFQSFIDEYNDADDDKDKFTKLVEAHKEGCDLQVQTTNDPERVEIELLDDKVNNPFSDFAPFPISDNEFVFSSLRADSAIMLPTDDESGDSIPYQKSMIYTSKLVDGSWTEAQLYPETINGGNQHVGNPTFSEDRQRMYFNKCVVGEELKLECSIYVSELQQGKWSDPAELKGDINTEGSTNTHPNVGKDADGKEVLYFTSDRETNSKGGKDIYYAEIKGTNEFGPVKNAGNINTEQDEVTPFYDHATGTLYFSSDKAAGIGGFDIYKTVDSSGTWTEPENLLAPINSSVDDIYFSINKDDKHGFIVSNRPGGYGLKSETCCDDIYAFTIIREVVLKGFVATQKDPETPIEGADVSFFVKKGEELSLIANFTTNAEEEFMVPLDPETVYQVNVTKSGYWGSEEVIDLSTMNVKDTLEKIFFIEEIARRKIQLKRVYYDFDRYNITRKYKVALDSLHSLLAANEGWTVEIFGHTDSIGTDPYNMQLAKRRAQSAADYLVAKGISIDRISLIAKGEEVPTAPNTTPSGADNPEGRAKNRRVEFLIKTNDENLEVDIEYLDAGPKEY